MDWRRWLWILNLLPLIPDLEAGRRSEIGEIVLFCDWLSFCRRDMISVKMANNSYVSLRHIMPALRHGVRGTLQVHLGRDLM